LQLIEKAQAHAKKTAVKEKIDSSFTAVKCAVVKWGGQCLLWFHNLNYNLIFSPENCDITPK